MASSLRLAAVLVSLFSAACGDSMAPTAQSALTLAAVSPASGATIHVTQGSPPGAFIPRGSALLSIPIAVTSGRDVPWAQLYVYLMSGPDSLSYCGQNLPDAPTWAPFLTRQSASVTITGFQIFRLPCDVSGIHAYFHTRNSGVGTPPVATDTIADGSIDVIYHLVP